MRRHWAAESSGAGADYGPDGNYSHCNNADREGNAWRIYDHRTEGEFHINKKDIDLASGESADYSAYGDAQGDGTLEGAVYGLFAAEDISHPDGKTGVVYRQTTWLRSQQRIKTEMPLFLPSRKRRAGPMIIKWELSLTPATGGGRKRQRISTGRSALMMIIQRTASTGDNIQTMKRTMEIAGSAGPF